MTTDIIRVQENERVDLEDFEFAAGQSLLDNTRQVVDQLLTKPGTQQTWVIKGFAIDNPSGSQLRVTRGSAILSYRDGATIKQGYIAAQGEAERILDLTGFAAGTYGIYVKFDLVASENASRVFWNAAGAGSEYVQVIPTRYTADWALCVELLPPGAEWFQIGEIVLPAMTITDKRNFYFEGRVETSYGTTWGSYPDRDPNRAVNGIQDFRTFTDMVRKTFQEIKGGTTKWYELGFDQCSWRTGINVGFEASAVADTVAVGDANFCMKWSSGYADLQGDGNDNKLRYDRTNFTWAFHVYDGVSVLLEVFNVGRNRVRHRYTGDTFKQLFTDEGDTYSGWIEYYLNGTSSRMKFRAAGSTLLELGQYRIYGHNSMSFDRGAGTEYANELGAFEFSIHCDYTSGAPRLDWESGYCYTQWDRTNSLLATYVTGWAGARWSAGKDGAKGGKEGLSDSDGTLQWLTGQDFGRLEAWVHPNSFSAVLSGLAVSYVRNDGVNNPGRAIKVNPGFGFANGRKVELSSAYLQLVTNASYWLSGGAPTGNRWCYAFCRPGLAYCMLSQYPPSPEGHLNTAETPQSPYGQEDYVFVGSFFYRYVSAGTQYIMPFVRNGDLVFIDGNLGGAITANPISDVDNYSAAETDIEVSSWVPHDASNPPYTSAVGIILSLYQTLNNCTAGSPSQFSVHHGKHDATLDAPLAGMCHANAITGQVVSEYAAQVIADLQQAGHDLHIHYHRSAVTASGRTLVAQMVGYVEPLNRIGRTMEPS